MAQRPKRFKRVSVSFPIDLYAKVDAAYRAAPPHSINSWIVEACRAALEPRYGTQSPLMPTEFHRDAFAMESPRLTDEQVIAVHDAIAEQGPAYIEYDATEYPNEPPTAASLLEKLPAEVAAQLQVGIPASATAEAFESQLDALDDKAEAEDAECHAQAVAEFGLRTLAVAARSVLGWHNWDWEERLEHLRELKAAAVSG